jgi:hypothetical protein
MWTAAHPLNNMLLSSITSNEDSNWRINSKFFAPMHDCRHIAPGAINLSPAWFDQGHDVRNKFLFLKMYLSRNSGHNSPLCHPEGDKSRSRRVGMAPEFPGNRSTVRRNYIRCPSRSVQSRESMPEYPQANGSRWNLS